MSYELEKAKAEKLKRTGLPLGTAKPTTNADVEKARQDKLKRTYK